MSTLVTGGAGFIGRHLIARLRDSGKPAVSYDRGGAEDVLPPGVTRVRGELSDVVGLANAITAHGVQAIVHAAGMSDPELSIKMPAAAVTANANGTLDLLEACRLARFGGRIVLLSSRTVYGADTGCADESSPLHPRTPYAATKAFGDLLGEAYARSYGLEIVSLRISETYGPGRNFPSLLEKVVDAALARHPLRLAADTHAVPRLVHVDDVARAIEAALTVREPARRIYEIPGERVHLEQVAAILRERMPDVEIDVGTNGAAGPDPGDGCEDVARAAASRADHELGYRPRWGLARGIDDLCAQRESETASQNSAKRRGR